MPVWTPRRRSLFPPVSWANEDGVVALGGRPDAETLKDAYSRGIFPWPHENVPLLWFCPDPRFVLETGRARIGRSLRKELRRGRFEVRADTAFERVMRACAEVPRPGQDGTWITDEMVRAYLRLHRLGLAHSFEAWEGEALAGGLYGVSLGAAYFGESMFADRPDASKVAFVRAVAFLAGRGVGLVDAQVRTEHLLRLGAHEIPRREFLARLSRALEKPTLRGRWTMDEA